AAALAERIGDHDGRFARVGLEIPIDGPDVLVAGDRPEAAAVRLVVPVDRGVLAQPAELRVRLAGGEAGGGEEIDLHRLWRGSGVVVGPCYGAAGQRRHSHPASTGPDLR